MSIRMVGVGFGSIVSAGRILAMATPESAPIRRMIAEAKDRAMLIDATYGRRTRAVIFLDTGHVVLSALVPETIVSRLGDR